MYSTEACDRLGVVSFVESDIVVVYGIFNMVLLRINSSTKLGDQLSLFEILLMFS